MPERPVERKLVAIFATDYTLLQSQLTRAVEVIE